MIRKFIDYITIERRYSKLTARAYEQDLYEFCSFLRVEPSLLDPASVTESDIRTWMVTLLDSGISARSVRRKLSSLRSFWKFLLSLGFVRKDITRSLVAPKMDKPIPVFFKNSEMEDAEMAMDWADDFVSVRDSLIIDLLYQTGMRRAELAGLKDADFDLTQMQVRVFGKRKKERIVPFGMELANRIRTYLDVRNDCFSLAPSPAQHFLLSRKGLPIPINTIYNIVRARMGEVSSLHKHSPHVLRHTFATAMLNNGADINTIKTLMGHSSLAATQIYTHTTFEQLKKAYNEAHPRAKIQKNTDF